ncbi:AT-rich interactive domain-containing protein 3B [Heterocephalus glaber]|uniref:AT-rich interactive domain-containing protein 3B n=1 Tax=Heterocephalus glaber TaxID=10181 RepID=G5C977_HETGA|nr:AT-rich interactive domain-containing protein 3B [Heterocephalus glaber]
MQKSERYMKYLYAYECEKKALSSPAELQAAIDGNRREGRRPSYSSSLFGYSPTENFGEIICIYFHLSNQTIILSNL